jgi:hypothetical protein
MAALSITAANVAAGATARKSSGTAGATITAGQLLYQDPADGLLKLADSDAGTAPPRSPIGIALHGASAGQPLAYLAEGPCTIGATLTAGVAYYASPTAGGISPVADLIAGNYPTIVGIATSTTVLDVRIHPSGVAL